MYNVIMHYLNSFLSCSIRNLTLSSSSRLFTIKIDVFFFCFTSFNSYSCLFSIKAISKAWCPLIVTIVTIAVIVQKQSISAIAE